MNLAAPLIALMLAAPLLGDISPELVKTRPKTNAVALTFDDGPDPRHTNAILDILKRYNIKATFFMVGFMAKAHPELVLAVKRAGHVIGNHSYDHPNFLKLSDTKRRSEIKKTNELLREITGTTPKCFRPPYGRKSEAIRKIAAEEGLATVIWDDCATFTDPDNAKSEAKWIVAHAHPGSVILLHDADGWGRRTKESLVEIIEGLQKKKLAFDTICE